MTDKYEDIRRALAMEPTPGPRRVIDGDSYPYVTVDLPENEGRRWDDPIICTLYEDVTPADCVGFSECLRTFPNARSNAALIAACDPDTIRALLAERDELRKALGRILENEASDWKAAEEFGGYVLDDELREEARAALAGISLPYGRRHAQRTGEQIMNTEQERAEFESWRRKHYDYDDLDAFEIEFAFDAYKAGRAAKKQALEEMEAVGYQERIIDKEWNRPVCDWYPISKELYESPRDIPETCRMRYETRILYATKEGKQ